MIRGCKEIDLNIGMIGNFPDRIFRDLLIREMIDDITFLRHRNSMEHKIFTPDDFIRAFVKKEGY